MLQKRTNILFDQEMWQMLTTLSKAENVSVGKLVREAVAKTYKKREKKLSREKAIDEIIRTRPILKGPVDYKALINDGRRY